MNEKGDAHEIKVDPKDRASVRFGNGARGMGAWGHGATRPWGYGAMRPWEFGAMGP